ncbi:MAG: hypothetical protein IJE93_08405 [Clostridia bacterium]|nr:hypothetical protein [Clostridia bacterium]
MVKKQLSDGNIVEAFPLTQAQRLMYFVYNSYGKNPAVLNIGTGCYWKGAFDTELLKQALYEAADRCESIRLRFSPDRQFGLVQYIADEHCIEITEHDHSAMSEEESFAILKDWTREGIDFIEKPLNTIRIMHLPDGYNGFYTKFHHLAFDGYAVKMFMADAMAIYLHKKIGSTYPKPMRSYTEAMKTELDYLESDQRKADRAYWMKTFSESGEPIFNDYLLDNRMKKEKEANPDRRYVLMFEGEHPESRTLHFDLSAEDSAKIIEMCRENNLSVPCVLMLGLRSALSAFNDNEKDVSFKFMINRRGTLLQKKSGGNRWHFYTLRTIVEDSLTFEEAAQIVEEEQNNVFNHCNFDTLEMYHIKHMAMKMDRLEQTYDSMSFSYHAPLEIPFESEEIKATAKGIWYNNDYSAQNLYLTVKHRLSDNGLEFIFEYRISENPKHDLEIFYSKLRSALMIGAENPKITIREILEKIKLEEN